MFNEIIELLHKAILEASKIPSSENKTFSFYSGGSVMFIKFFPGEVEQMPKSFREDILIHDCCAHVRKDVVNGKPFYTIRYYHDGFNIQVSSNDLALAKEEFIKQANLRYGEAESVTEIAFNIENGAEVARLGY